ncbi:LysR family transcriptional regulator [Dactylosporangium sp. CS-033363]|uniref:LysR family transcriptional regulator n=1 Tax=Dactylosporangium sp. CS-033363 TaxID=3239935 RepID=UPI003D9300EC
MDLDAVRTFVTAADAGQFQEAAAQLSITQQAVSKRIAALERDLEVRLFTRTARGARLTVDGQAFLPHARELLRVADRADASVRPGRRALRVDVVNRRIAPAVLLQEFYRSYPMCSLDVVTLAAGVDAAVAELVAGAIDATFHAVPDEEWDGIESIRVIDEPHELLVGPRHPFAARASVTPRDLAGHRIRMPGLSTATEWGVYYEELAAAFALTIDPGGPIFGNEALLAEIAGSPDVATLVGAGSWYMWPDAYDLRRIPILDPAPVYPMSLLWRRTNPHPALAQLRAFAADRYTAPAPDVWLPSWVRRPAATPARSRPR